MTMENGGLERQTEKGQVVVSAKGVKGTIIEVPETKPFEGHTYLKKSWIDKNEGITKVLMHMVVGHLNKPPCWDDMDVFEMMPEWGTEPLRRSWVIRIPTHYEGEVKYLLHYYFVSYYEDGNECISQTFTEQIMPKAVQFIDHSGQYSHVRLHWSAEGWSYPQNTELEFESIDWGSEYSVSHFPYKQGDRLYERGRAAIIARTAPPRLFKGIIWAPHKEKINYCFNLISLDQTGELLSHWDNNNGLNYQLTI